MTATHHPSQRETQGAIDFDAALEGYACGYDDPEVLLRAAGLVLGSTILLDEEHAMAIARLTGAIVKLQDYDDAGRAVQRWFAAKAEAGITDW
ncbi:MAG TPA: hypothetical protein VH913_08010 [Hyphomicrobiaceae bacterium]|jgi:hypothetical protein